MGIGIGGGGVDMLRRAVSGAVESARSAPVLCVGSDRVRGLDIMDRVTGKRPAPTATATAIATASQGEGVLTLLMLCLFIMFVVLCCALLCIVIMLCFFKMKCIAITCVFDVPANEWVCMCVCVCVNGIRIRV